MAGLRIEWSGRAISRVALSLLATWSLAEAAAAADVGRSAAGESIILCSDYCGDDYCCDIESTCMEPCDCGNCCGECCCKPCCCRGIGHDTGVWGDFLLLSPTDADVAHAQQQNGTGGAGTVPFGVIGVVDPAYEPGFRVGGTIGLSPCSSLQVAYSYYESDAVQFLVAPVVPGGGGAVGSLVHHPGAGIISSAGPVQAAYGIDYQLGEFKYRALLCGDQCGYVNWGVGARYAHLEQDFYQTGLFSGSQAGVLDTTTSVEFDGGGALFGLDGERRFGRSGFSVYGNLGISPIVGQFTTQYDMVNSSTAVQLAQARWKDDRFVTILDVETGLAWTSCQGRVRFSAGWLSQHWYNVITTGEFIDAVRANNYNDASATLSFDGLVTRVELRF